MCGWMHTLQSCDMHEQATDTTYALFSVFQYGLFKAYLISQFRSVNMNTGDIAFSMVDSLSAFFPGLQVLAGDVENAIKSHLMCTSWLLT